MSFETLVTHFGYPAVSLGTIVEGETALILGGFLAQKSVLSMVWVIAIAFATTLGCDQFFFYLGRTNGAKTLAQRPKWKEKSTRVVEVVHRHHVWIAIFFRFIYGFRSVTPFAIGLSGVPPLRFLLLNLIGITLWVFSLSWLGYFFGHAVQKVMNNVQHMEFWILGIMICAGLGIWGLYSLSRFLRGKVMGPKKKKGFSGATIVP